MKVLLTGGTGLAGSHIAELLKKEKINVTAIVRANSDTSHLSSLEIPLIQADITDKEQVDKITGDFDAVIHTAAKCSDWGSYDSFYRTNVTGTLNILEFAHIRGIKNVIVTGSISSYGEENYQGKKDESYPFKSHYPYFLDKVFPCRLNYYRDTKALCEKETIRFAKEKKMEITIIEPVWIFGEREFHSGFYEYLLSVKKGNRLMPGSSKNKFHVIYAGDLAKAYLLALKKERSGTTKYLAGNRCAQNMDTIFSLFCEKANIPVPKKVPKWLIYPAAFFIEMLYTVLNKKNPPPLTRGRVNMFYDNIEYDVAKIEKELGFKAETPLEEAIEKTVEWYKENKYL
jgi:nucleoside-diphosphate-sugar epimerase